MSTITKPPGTTIPRATFDVIERQRAGHPILLKIDDLHEYEIKDETSFQKLLDLLERLDNIAAIQKGLDDIAGGNTLSVAEFKQQILESHGISD